MILITAETFQANGIRTIALGSRPEYEFRFAYVRLHRLHSKFGMALLGKTSLRYDFTGTLMLNAVYK